MLEFLQRLSISTQFSFRCKYPLPWHKTTESPPKKKKKSHAYPRHFYPSSWSKHHSIIFQIIFIPRLLKTSAARLRKQISAGIMHQTFFPVVIYTFKWTRRKKGTLMYVHSMWNTWKGCLKLFFFLFSFLYSSKPFLFSSSNTCSFFCHNAQSFDER